MAQTVRIDYFADQALLFCIFCGLQIVSDDGVKPCPHLLFIATEDGYDYQSELVKDILPPVEVEEDEEPDDYIGAFMGRLNAVAGFPPDSFFIEAYGTALDPGGVYFGFSPPIW